MTAINHIAQRIEARVTDIVPGTFDYDVAKKNGYIAIAGYAKLKHSSSFSAHRYLLAVTGPYGIDIHYFATNVIDSNLRPYTPEDAIKRAQNYFAHMVKELT